MGREMRDSVPIHALADSGGRRGRAPPPPFEIPKRVFKEGQRGYPLCPPFPQILDPPLHTDAETCAGVAGLSCRKAASKDEHAKQEQKFYHDWRHGVRPLTMLHPGDQVRVKLDTQRQWSEPVTVVQEHETLQSYVVASPMGDRRRNRKHLQKIPVGELDQSVGADEEPTGKEPSSDTCDTKTVQEPRTSKRSMRRPKRLIKEV